MNYDLTFFFENKLSKELISKRKLEDKHRDFFVFGHRHLPLNIDLKENSKYINLGDWIQYYTYGVLDGETMELKEY